MQDNNTLDAGFSKSTTIRPNESRGKAVIVTLWISLVLILAIIGSELLVYFTVNRGFTGFDSHLQLLETYLIINAILVILSVVLLIVSAVFWIQWMRRAFFNLHQLKVANLPYSEGYAAGGWFIPIAMYWIPVQIMMSVWKNTQELVIENKRLIENGALVSVWWALYLFDRISSTVLNYTNTADDLEFNAYNVQAYYEALESDTMATLLVHVFATLPLTIAAMAMVKKSTKMQKLLYLKEKGEEITTEMITGK